IERARELAAGRKRESRSGGGMKSILFDKNPAGRAIVFKQAREQTLARTKGKYPAPLAAIEAVAAGYSRGKGKGYREEARLFGEMAMTEESKQLIFLFFATNALKKDIGIQGSIGASQSNSIGASQDTDGDVSATISPRKIKKLGILGAGFMGSGIASIAV